MGDWNKRKRNTWNINTERHQTIYIFSVVDSVLCTRRRVIFFFYCGIFIYRLPRLYIGKCAALFVRRCCLLSTKRRMINANHFFFARAALQRRVFVIVLMQILCKHFLNLLEIFGFLKNRAAHRAYSIRNALVSFCVFRGTKCETKVRLLDWESFIFVLRCSLLFVSCLARLLLLIFNFVIAFCSCCSCSCIKSKIFVVDDEVFSLCFAYFVLLFLFLIRFMCLPRRFALLPYV